MAIRTQRFFSTLSVRLHPSSSRSEVVSVENDVWKIRVTARPIENGANEALVSLVADKLGIAKGRITIAGGAKSRLKMLEIEGLNDDAVRTRLERCLSK